MLASVGIYIAIAIGKNALDTSKDKKMTATLPENIQNLISGTNSIKDFKEDFKNKPLGFNKYLYLRDLEYTGDNNKPYFYVYGRKINKGLNTDVYMNDADIDGIIISKSFTRVVGHYTNSTRFTANQMGCALSYIKLPENTIVYRDTVWGGEPPKNLKIKKNQTSGSATGSKPNDETVINTILSTVK